MESLERWRQLLPFLHEAQSLPRVEVEVRPRLAPPSPFVLGQIKDELKEEPSHYVELFKKIFKAAKEGKLEFNKMVELCKAAYECSYDFGYKSPHQARAYVPRITRNVDIVANYLRRMLVENQEFFSVVSVSSRIEDIVSAHAIQKIVKYILDLNNLSEKFSVLVKMGLLYGLMCVKVYVLPRKVTHIIVDEDGKIRSIERNLYQIKIDVVRPEDIYLDPTGLNKFIIHRLILDKSDLIDWANMGVLNRDAVEKLIAKAPKGGMDKAPSDEKTGQHVSVRRLFAVFEYWGDVWGDDGELLHRNILMIFGAPLGVDGKELEDFVLLKGPIPNPYWHQSPPFVIGNLSPSPSRRVYPKSVASFLVDLQREYTRILNAMLDGAIFDAVSVYEVNDYLVENPKDLDEIWSGKMIRKRGEGQVISPVQLGKMPTAASFIVQLLERYLLEGFGVTETVLGYLSSRGRPTATEVVTARAQAFSSIEEMGKIVENNFLEPMIERVYQVAIQVLPELVDDEMLNALGDASEAVRRLLAMSPSERESLMRGGYRFRIRGMSLMLTKAQELARINEFLQVVASIPMFAQKINWDALLMKVIESYGWSPSEVLVSGTSGVIIEGGQINVPNILGLSLVPPIGATPIVTEEHLAGQGRAIEAGSETEEEPV